MWWSDAAMPQLTTFNLAHFHLMLNHVPTIGTVVALGLLMVGYTRRDDGLKHIGLEVLFMIAVLTVPAYMTGVGAYQALRKAPDVSDIAIRVHQDVALIAFTVTEIAGFVGWLALWQWRRRGRAARGIVPLTMALVIAALATMGGAASLGGEIRHPEIGSSMTPEIEAMNADQFWASVISVHMTNSTWIWPAAEAVHFLGLCLSVGILLAVNLRILGVMRQVPFAEMHRLLPWGMLGFGANLITGMLFFVGQPNQYLVSEPFYWKVIFLMIAGANFLYLTVFKAWDRERSANAVFVAGLPDRAMAITSLVAWFGVLYAGRMLPFLGRAF
jgi:hypothetical protein